MLLLISVVLAVFALTVVMAREDSAFLPSSNWRDLGRTLTHTAIGPAPSAFDENEASPADVPQARGSVGALTQSLIRPTPTHRKTRAPQVAPSSRARMWFALEFNVRRTAEQ